MDQVKEGRGDMAGGKPNGIEVGSERARRFYIQMSLRYRVRGESKWRAGVTENISSTGVLFRADRFAELETQIEMSLTLPADNSAGPAELICRGTIVRAEPPRNGAALATLASKILHYRFMRL